MSRKFCLFVGTLTLVVMVVLLVNRREHESDQRTDGNKKLSELNDRSEWRPARRTNARANNQSSLTFEEAYLMLVKLGNGAREKARSGNGISSISTAGLRSGDYAVTRDSIDSILSNPSRGGTSKKLQDARKALEDRITRLVGALSREHMRTLILEFYQENQRAKVDAIVPWEVNHIVVESIRCLTSKHPRKTIAWLKENKIPLSDHRILLSVADGWASVDPEEALKFVRKVRSNTAVDMEWLSWLLVSGSSPIKVIYKQYADKNYLESIQSAHDEVSYYNKSMAYMGVVNGLPADADFKKVAYELAFFALPHEAAHKETGKSVIAQINEKLALRWLDNSPDDALAWYKTVTQYDPGARQNRLLQDILQSWAAQSPQKLLVWASGKQNGDMKMHAAHALGTVRYDLALKLASRAADSESRILLAKYATRRRALLPHTDIAQLDDLPIIGRLFSSFDLGRASEFINFTKASSLNKKEKQELVSWIEKTRDKYSESESPE